MKVFEAGWTLCREIFFDEEEGCQNLSVIFSSLSLEYLSSYHEFLNADASSSTGRARNSCEFGERTRRTRNESPVWTDTLEGRFARMLHGLCRARSIISLRSRVNSS